jgi:hypothetical protein
MPRDTIFLIFNSNPVSETLPAAGRVFPAMGPSAYAKPTADPLPADDIPLVVPVVEAGLVVPIRKASLLRRMVRGVGSAGEWIFGVATLIVGLAVLAAIPIVQFLSLGYLLEASGRIARTGRFRSGFVGVRKAARVGDIVLGTWLVLLPVKVIASLAADAQLIDADGPLARRWRVALAVLTALAVIHLAAA